MVLAVATVFVNLGEWVSQVLILLGILAGFFHYKIKNELVSLGVIYLGLVAVSSSMNNLIVIGPYITDVVAARVRFLGQDKRIKCSDK